MLTEHEKTMFFYYKMILSLYFKDYDQALKLAKNQYSLFSTLIPILIAINTYQFTLTFQEFHYDKEMSRIFSGTRFIKQKEIDEAVKKIEQDFQVLQKFINIKDILNQSATYHVYFL